MSMLLRRAFMGATATAAKETLYVDDVFSTYLYTGNGSTQTINNGILLGDGLSLRYGDPVGGGYFFGEGTFGGEKHILIMADKVAEVSMQWKISNNVSPGTEGLTDGLLNSNAMNDASHPAAQYCRAYRGGGHDDWYLWAKNEAKEAWINLAPTAAKPPFNSGGDQALSTTEWYWTSTQGESAATTGTAQRFSDGGQSTNLKSTSYLVRPVRRVPLSDPSLDPYRVKGEGGLVWLKNRASSSDVHNLYDTVRGEGKSLITSLNAVENAYGHSTGLTSFTPTGFQVGAHVDANRNGGSFTSWTFRRTPKFFDVVTYTGNGVAGRRISHSLGQAPGMIIVKKTSNTGNWITWHRTFPTVNDYIMLNNTGGMATQIEMWGTFAPTSTDFGIHQTSLNSNGDQYVAYLWAHDPSEDGIVQCGSYVGNGIATGPVVPLGWEPQYVLIKRIDVASSWIVFDSARGMPVGSAGDPYLLPNGADAEAGDGAAQIGVSATGFFLENTFSISNASGGSYIYLAIRRPNKPPKSGTEVFEVGQNRTSLTHQIVGTIGPIDLTLQTQVPTPLDIYHFAASDRLRGNVYSATSKANSEVGAYLSFDTNVGVRNAQWFSNGGLWYNFKRAPGFFDVVCYTGTGVARTVPHGLGVAPELCIIKSRRTANTGWLVGSPYIKRPGFPDQPAVAFLHLNNSAVQKTGLFAGNGSASDFTDTAISFAGGSNVIGPDGSNLQPNTNDSTYVAYLFATLPGISKVGSYTGNGSSQTIDCGFSTGARFILIKRTDAAGDWYVWDSARGIVAANDPHLSLNTSAAEVTTNDSVDPEPTGFIINQVAATNINVSGGQYIFLTIA